MKKIFVILMAICLLASILCTPAFAEEALPAGTVLRISAISNSSTVVIDHYSDFEKGWSAAISLSLPKSMKATKYERIIVDLYADWTAADDGNFTDDGPLEKNDEGFKSDTIHIPDDAKITLNLNGHTINRNLKGWENNGEVILIDEDADVIINNGTITGGWSCNGAGGLHIKDDAKVTLNNVNIVGNKVDDANGAGIAVHDGAILTMNGGCVSHNESYNDVYGGGVYVYEASAFFKDVTFQDNQGIYRSTRGAAVYVDDGTLEMEKCNVIGNGLNQASNGAARKTAYSIINISGGSEVTLKETTFSGNGYGEEIAIGINKLRYSTVISSTASYLTIETCTFKANNQVYLIQSEASALKALDSDFTENNSFAFFGNCAFNSEFARCKFSYNEPMLSLDDTFYFNISNAGLSFVDCSFGEATFNNKNAAKFINTNAQNTLGSIFGEGSLTMIVALLALITSAVSIFLTVYYNKKKANPVAADNKN